MAVESLSERPIFASEENDYLLPNRPPVSRLAIASLILGLISALVLLNADLVALPIAAAAIGLSAYWLTSRNDGVSGGNMALIGAALGVAFGIWSVTNVQLRNQYLYQVGAQFAKHYLDTVAQGKLFEAYELMLPEAARQVAGSSLEAHYSSLDQESRSGLDSFKSERSTLKVIERGSKAQWQFRSGQGVGRLLDNAREVVVRMVDVSDPSASEVELILSRSFNASIASWRVVKLR